MTAALHFRFESEEHLYIALDTGETLPSITQMLKSTCWVDDTFFSEDSCDRGTAVHTLTADYDLGALHLETCVSPFRGYALGWAQAARALRAEWSHIEVPMVHRRYRFGGRPDRIGIVIGGLKTVVEVKSGAPTKSHAIQTALQAVLAADEGGLPAEHYQRLAVYLKPNGKFSIERFINRRDFDVALDVIRTCCVKREVA